MEPRGRTMAVILFAAIPLATLIALLAMAFTDELGASRLFADAGAVVTWSRPVVRVIHDLAAALTVGMSVLTAWALPGARHHQKPRGLNSVQRHAMRWTAAASGVWAGAAAASLIVSVADISGLRLSSPELPSLVVRVAVSTEFGQNLLAVLILSITVSALALLSRSFTGIGWTTGIAILALVPLALSGHASGSDDHGNAVNALGVHLLSITVWLGGLAGLIILAPRLGGSARMIVSRYSSLALWAFLGVAASGLVNAVIRVRVIENLATPYGLLILAKSVLLIGLGMAGWWQRRRIVPHFDDAGRSRRAFLRLAVTEVLVMAIAMGLSVALASSAPPAQQLTPGADASQRALLGFPMPAPLTPERWLTTWNLDLLWVAAAVIGCAWYLRAAHRLRARGDRWPLLRDISFVTGCVLLVWITGARLRCTG